MSGKALTVDERLSWARRTASEIEVVLRLPDADLAPGATQVRLGRGAETLRVDGEVRGDDGAAVVSFAVPRVSLDGAARRIRIQASADGRAVAVAARLLARPGQPVALLPGPAPTTRMPPPAPRSRATDAGRGRATPLRRALRRGRRVARAARQAVRRAPAGRGDRPAGKGERAAGRGDRPVGKADRPVGKGDRRSGRRDRAVGLTVAVVDGAAEAAEDAVRREAGGGELRLVRADDVRDLDHLELELLRSGAPDRLVVAVSPGSLARLGVDQRGLYDRLSPQVRHRGTYVVRTDVGPGEQSDDDLRRALASGRGVRGTAMEPGRVTVGVRGRHYLNLREDEAAELLPAREPATEVSTLEVRPAGSTPVLMTEHSYGAGLAEPWPERLDHPELAVRHYRGDFVSRGSMLVTGASTILPESFRWPYVDGMRHANVPTPTPRLSRLPRPRRSEAPVLEGDYYFLDCLFSGHFGHLLTEVVCRLWGWDAARRELPGLKAVFHTNPRAGRDGSLERRLFAAYGIPESDLVATDRPVRLTSVVGASPMWHNATPFYAHPGIREVWERMTAGLLGGREPASYERLFVSRGETLNRRRCRNQAEVEQFFADRGFHVIYPERLPLDEQAALFAGARVVAGFAGSAMFNLMHARRLETTVVISHDAYQARNEYLYASILGGDLHYFWQDSDIPLGSVKSTKTARRASFAFDFDRYGADLARVLERA